MKLLNLRFRRLLFRTSWRRLAVTVVGVVDRRSTLLPKEQVPRSRFREALLFWTSPLAKRRTFAFPPNSRVRVVFAGVGSSGELPQLLDAGPNDSGWDSFVLDGMLTLQKGGAAGV